MKVFSNGESASENKGAMLENTDQRLVIDKSLGVTPLVSFG
jgi:hypothetical protein